MDSHYNFKRLYGSMKEGVASEHPDTQGQENFQKRADEILARRKEAREKAAAKKAQNEKNAKLDAAGKRIREMNTIKREEYELGEEKDHEYSMARSELSTASDAIQKLRKRLKGEKQLEAWVQSKITKASDYLRSASDYLESGESRVNEEHMTKSDIKKEEKLKKKYDPSGMKASMISRYGPEKGKQVYFATIRKQAMEEGFIDPEDEIPTSDGRPGRKPIENVASHPNPKVRKRAIRGMRTQMEKEYGGKWKAKSKDPAMEEDFDYLDEMKIPKDIKDNLMDFLMKKYSNHKIANRIRTSKQDEKAREKKIPRALMTAGYEYKSLYEMQSQQDIEDDDSQDEIQNRTSNPQAYINQLEKIRRRKKLIQKARDVVNAIEGGLEDDYNYELDEAKISRTERRARNAAKNSKGSQVHAYDMDETLMGHDHSKVKVHVNDSSGKRVQSLTNQEFNTHKLPKGHSYDFSEFRSSKIFKQSARPNKSVIKKLKKQVKQGKDVHIITARADMDSQPEFAHHLRRHGIEINPQQGRKHIHVHRAGNVEGGDIGQKKVQILHGIMAKTGAKKAHMYDDAAKVHDAFQQANRENPSGPQVKTHLAKPNKRGKVMIRSYQATKEEFELWVNALIDEGYDLSEFSVEELIEAYAEIIDEAVTAVAAPGESDKNRPIKKGPRPLNYKSLYGKNVKNKKNYTEEVKEPSPYDYWKSFIGEDKIEEVAEDVIEESTEMVEKPVTSYEYWKAKIEEQAGSEDRGERHVAHDVAMKKRDPNQKTTIIPTASRPGNSPSLNLPMSSVPHVHTPNSKVK